LDVVWPTGVVKHAVVTTRPSQDGPPPPSNVVAPLPVHVFCPDVGMATLRVTLADAASPARV
jgi:hypothetical protein